MYEITCEILAKVDEIVNLDTYSKSDNEEDKSDFEVIPLESEQNRQPFKGVSDYLDTIDEHEMTEATISVGPEQPMVNTDDEFEKILDGNDIKNTEVVLPNDGTDDESSCDDSNDETVFKDDASNDETVGKPFIQR